MTEIGRQNAGVISGFAFPSWFCDKFVNRIPDLRNLAVRNEEEDWLFQDTNIADRPLPSIRPIQDINKSSPTPGSSDSEQGTLPSPSKSNASGGRETTILGEDDEIVEIKVATFLGWSLVREVMYFLCCVATGGLAFVVCSTWPRVYTWLRFQKLAQNDEDAERVLVESMDGNLTLVDIMWVCERGSEKLWLTSSSARFLNECISSRPRMFVWRDERFWFNHQNGSWVRRGFNTEITYADMHSVASNCALKEIGHNAEESQKLYSREKRSLVYGPNQLNVEVPDFGHLLMREVFKPFFLFQVFSIISWLLLDYEIYACVVLLLTTISVLYSVIETRQNLLAVKTLAASECEVKRLILVADETAQLRLRPVLVSSSELLPGDIVQVEPGMIFPCDLLLLVGQCIVNESMLTGESAPVSKSPLPVGYSAFGQVFQTESERDGRYKLLSGTKVLQVKGSSNPYASFSNSEVEKLQRPVSIWQFVTKPPTILDPLASKDVAIPVAAMVIGTAFATSKGQLVRAIIYPKPSKYDFERKLFYFMANLCVYLVVVCTITVVWQYGRETNIAILQNCINLVTIAVPPALPLALSIGLSVSFGRLKAKDIFCISPNRIINAGRINTLCFDKTGTLTEDGLSLKGILPVIIGHSESNALSLRCGSVEEDLQSVYLYGSQACHTLDRDVSYDTIVLSRLGLFYTLVASHSITLLDKPANNLEEPVDLVSHKEPGLLAKGWKQFGSGMLYCAQTTDDVDVPSKTDEVVYQPSNLFIGDPLEVQMFSKTGWIYLSRPDDFVGQSEEESDPQVIWSRIHPSVDTVLVPPRESGSKQILAVLRRFDFDSEIRLMSSIVLEMPSVKATFDESRTWLLVKGAPESLQEICDGSSLPLDFKSQLQEVTLSGFRVLACGYRLLGSLSVQQAMMASRSQMESGITFSGFIVMENKLKSETPGVLQDLAKAGLREIMVTGDNPLTAVSVARQCGPFFLGPSYRTFLIDRSPDNPLEPFRNGCILKELDSELEIEMDTFFPGQVELDISIGRVDVSNILGAVNIVVTGRAFSALSVQHDQFLERYKEEKGVTHVQISDCITPFQMVLCQSNIFSRMSPQNKLDLMRSLQDLGYLVCMTGDGANDSGALKAADVGISIASKPLESDDTMAAGPSIAAPFNTKLAHIGVVRTVLAEGRCALVNATVMFKYMYFYALIQATAVMVLYRYQFELADYQYLWADLGLVFPMVLFMPATQPRQRLSRGRPESNLLAYPVLMSVYGQSFFIVIFQAIAQVFLQQQDWYYNPNDSASVNRRFAVEIPAFDREHNQNSTVSFLFSAFQYVSTALALSQSFGVFRCSPLTNIPLTITICTLFILCSLFMVKPMTFSVAAFSLVDLSDHESFLYFLWLLAVANSLIFVVFERYAVKHKSTEFDMPTVYDYHVQGEHSGSSESSLPRAIALLKGQGETCYPIKSVLPSFFHVAKFAAPVWTRLESS